MRPVGCGTDWPCFNGSGPFRNTSFTGYDPQGRLLSASDAATFAETTTASYTPLGHLATSTQTQQWIGATGNPVTYTGAETLTHDGFGTLVGPVEGWTVAVPGGSTTTNATMATAFDLSNGQLTSLSPGNGAGTWSKAYDAAGNLEWEQRVTNPNPAEERASFYAADQTLAVVDRRTGTTRWSEHYRYDPLGRRVLVISQVQCAPLHSLECQASRIRRTVWDGAQGLGEIQVPYDSTAYWEQDTGPYPRLTGAETLTHDGLSNLVGQGRERCGCPVPRATGRPPADAASCYGAITFSRGKYVRYRAGSRVSSAMPATAACAPM